MDKVPVVFKGGSLLIKYAPQFALNSEHIFIACKNLIFCYNIKTGARVNTFKGIKKSIVGFKVHTYDGHECITACSKSGEIITWKTATQFKFFKKNLDNYQINSFNIISINGDEMIALISYYEYNNLNFVLLNLNTLECDPFNLNINSNDNCLFDGSNPNFFCVAQNNKIMFISIKNKLTSYKSIKNKAFTCISCHPTDDIVLSGDNLGRALLWYDLFKGKPIHTIYHWHTLPLKSVCFSPSGSYFYTGGDECVLVKWHIDDSYDRKFLPRLSANIEQLSVSENNLYTAICTSDNAIIIIDSTFKQISLIQHLVIGDNFFESGITYDPKTRSLIMNGNVGHLQFYNPNDQSLLYNLDVVGQNKITNERNMEIQNTEISKVAINKNGIWLAIIELRLDNETFSEMRLKFWHFDETKQSFQLNTCIENPHELNITSILFQPTNSVKDLKCVTVGDDKNFRIWQLMPSTDIYKKNDIWVCSIVGHFRDLYCHGLSFSMDGSLIAVGFEQIVTTWQPDSCELKCTLLHPDYKENIKYLQFGQKQLCHLLVSAYENHLIVWNLLTLSVIWVVPVKINLLIVNYFSTAMAAVAGQYIFIFDPDSPEPFFKKYLKNNYIYTGAFIPNNKSINNDTYLNWYQKTPLYFIGKDRKLFCFGDDDEDDNFITYEEEKMSVFNKIQADIKISNVEIIKPVSHKFQKDSTKINKFLEGTLPAMAPMRLTCGALLRSMLLQKDDNYSLVN